MELFKQEATQRREYEDCRVTGKGRKKLEAVKKKYESERRKI